MRPQNLGQQRSGGTDLGGVWADRRRATRGATGERGVAIVEAAFVAPIFFLLVFSILEFGFAFSDRLTAENMSQTGARTGASAADAPLSDYSILRKIRAESAEIPAARLTDIVVYKASGPNDAFVPGPGCVATSGTTVCNRYTGADLGRPEADFGCDPSPGTDVDFGWCPAGRNVTLATPGPDYIGVYVRVEHPTITGFFGNEFVFTSDTVMRIEPRRAQ